jgi:hypothetical protein
LDLTFALPVRGCDVANVKSAPLADMTRLVHDAGSEAADIDGARTRTAAALGQALAAIGGGAAVVTVMTADVAPVAGRRGLRPGAVADDSDWLA